MVLQVHSKVTFAITLKGMVCWSFQTTMRLASWCLSCTAVLTGATKWTGLIHWPSTCYCSSEHFFFFFVMAVHAQTFWNGQPGCTICIGSYALHCISFHFHHTTAPLIKSETNLLFFFFRGKHLVRYLTCVACIKTENVLTTSSDKLTTRSKVRYCTK